MERIETAIGAMWAVQMVIPFTFGDRTFKPGDWILGDGPLRLALTDAAFKERRAALEVRPRCIA